MEFCSGRSGKSGGEAREENCNEVFQTLWTRTKCILVAAALLLHQAVMVSLAGKVVLITGATTQIGVATALSLAKRKCLLALTSHQENTLKELGKECQYKAETKDRMLLTLPADLTVEKNAQNVIKDTFKYFGRINVLVNCEDKFALGTAGSTPLKVFDEIMNMNTRLAFHMIQLAIPHLRSTKGNIVNVSSIASFRSFPGMAVYGISKSALDHLTRTAAIELVTEQIRVNSVNPTLYLMGPSEFEPQDRKRLQEQSASILLGRYGYVAEVVSAIEYLASDEASFVTGVTFPVDGGRSTFCPQQYSEN